MLLRTLLLVPLAACMQITGGRGVPAAAPPVEICVPEAGDPFELDSARIGRDLLKATLIYGGGCRDHDFRACWDGLFMETWPVGARLLLDHDDHDDPCDALIRETRAFDLRPLRLAWEEEYGPPPGTIVIHLEDQVLRYDF